MADYYVSLDGDDNNDGLTESEPFKTVGAVTDISWTLTTGDTVNFRGGDFFVYSDRWNLSDDMTADPIEFSSYGTGKATLASSNANGFWVRGNGKGVVIHDLIFTSATTRRVYGVYIIDPFLGSVEVYNCDFYNTRNGILNQVPNCTFRNCRIFGSDSTPILANQGFSNNGTTDFLTIQDNYTIGSGYANGSLSHAVYLSNGGTQDNTSATGNTFINTRNMNDQSTGCSSTIIVAHGEEFKNILIEDNHIIEEDGTAEDGCYAIGISPSNPSQVITDSIVRGNTVEGFGNRGISIEGCTRPQIYNNAIIHTGTKQPNGRGISIGEKFGVVSTDAEVYNNTIQLRNATTTPVLVEATSNTVRNEHNTSLVYADPLYMGILKAPVNGYLSAFTADGGFTYVSETATPHADSFQYRVRDSVYQSGVEDVTLDIT